MKSLVAHPVSRTGVGNGNSLLSAYNECQCCLLFTSPTNSVSRRTILLLISPLPMIVNNRNLSSRFHKTLSMMRKKNCIRIFKPFGRSVSQNPVEPGCTEVRREGHVPTSRPPKSHVVDRHPFAEPPEGHTPTAFCEISLHHPVRPSP